MWSRRNVWSGPRLLAILEAPASTRNCHQTGLTPTRQYHELKRYYVCILIIFDAWFIRLFGNLKAFLALKGNRRNRKSRIQNGEKPYSLTNPYRFLQILTVLTLLCISASHFHTVSLTVTHRDSWAWHLPKAITPSEAEQLTRSATCLRRSGRSFRLQKNIGLQGCKVNVADDSRWVYSHVVYIYTHIYIYIYIYIYNYIIILLQYRVYECNILTLSYVVYTWITTYESPICLLCRDHEIEVRYALHEWWIFKL